MRERGLKYTSSKSSVKGIQVAPYAGAWIEIISTPKCSSVYRVAPYAGAWIEMPQRCTIVRICGVAPYAGAWIEILCGAVGISWAGVAPYAGAWIEITLTKAIGHILWSLPMRERGLKLC